MAERRLAIADEVKCGFAIVVDLLQTQSQIPPGNDPCIGACYETLVSLIEVDSEVSDFFQQIYQKRFSITPAHFVNLLFRSIQHIQLNMKEDRSYLDFETSEEWRPVLVDILSSEDKDILEELLLTKDTITTKYQRYAGPRAILSAYWNGNPVSVADFGCGANVGLPGMELNIPFQEIYDETPGSLVAKELKKPVNLQSGLAVDKENPEDPRVKAWSMACSFYPKELKAQITENGLVSDFRSSRNVSFLQADLLSRSTMIVIPRSNFDAVILSTVLYQKTQSEREDILAEAKRAITPTGAIIVQDFAQRSEVNPNKLEFNGAWGGGEFGYRTFVIREQPEQELLEVLQWADGRCRIVRAGENFNAVFH